MYNYFALGCSLTQQDGFVNYFNIKYNLNIENLAVGAGSNQLQMHKMNNLLLQEKINSDTILLWQVTSADRPFDLFHAYDVTYKQNCKYTGYVSFIEEHCELTRNKYTATLCNNYLYEEQKIYNLLKNNDYNFQNLICDIYKFSLLVKHIILFLGWKEVSSVSAIRNGFNFLNSTSNITCIDTDKSIVDWCKSKELDFWDDYHPKKNSYEKWAVEVLEPILIKYIN